MPHNKHIDIISCAISQITPAVIQQLFRLKTFFVQAYDIDTHRSFELCVVHIFTALNFGHCWRQYHKLPAAIICHTKLKLRRLSGYDYHYIDWDDLSNLGHKSQV